MSASDPSGRRRMELPCPCESGFPLAACCAPFIAGLAPAPTAEALMRSRYTAFTLNRMDYIVDTWHPRTRPASAQPERDRRWLGLTIRGVSGGGPGDTEGTVEFVARFRAAGRAHRLHEVSRFRFQDGRWYYLDGEVSGR